MTIRLSPTLSLRPRTTRATRRVMAVVGWSALVLFMALPIISILMSSVSPHLYWSAPPGGFTLANYVTVAEGNGFIDSFVLSVTVSLAVAAVSIILALLAALAARRLAPRQAAIVAGLSLLPIFFPHIALGLAMYIFMIDRGAPINSATLAFAQLMLTLPFCIGVIGLALRRFNPHIEQAAMSLGAPPHRVTLSVVLPAIAPSIAGAAIISIAGSLDDASIALFVNSPTALTLPVKLLLSTNDQPGPVIAAGGTILFLLGLLLLMIGWAIVGIGRLAEMRQK